MTVRGERLAVRGKRQSDDAVMVSRPLEPFFEGRSVVKMDGVTESAGHGKNATAGRECHAIRDRGRGGASHEFFTRGDFANSDGVVPADQDHGSAIRMKKDDGIDIQQVAL